MFEWICFILGIFCLGVSILFAIKFRHDTKKSTGSVLIGIIITSFWFILPIISVSVYDKGVFDALYKILKSMFYSKDVIGGGQDISQIYGIHFKGAFKLSYIYISYAMFVSAPLLTATWFISLFGDFGEKIRYAFHFSKNCYVFSELNENSLSIARGIKKSENRTSIVFCSTKDVDNDIIIIAKKLGCVCFSKSCVDFNVGWFHSLYNYYLVSDIDDKNICQASNILDKYSKRKNFNKDKLIVTAFAQSGTTIDIIETKNKNKFKVRFIDNEALLCDQIIFKYPLYNLPNDSKDISVMIVGCGRTGMQMLKTIAWCGQIDGYNLKIRVYDNDENIKDLFYTQAPELYSSEYDIEFIKADILSSDFEEKICQSLDATYVFVSTGNDDLNLKTACKIREILRRKTGRYDVYPTILTRVRDGSKSTNLKDNSYLESRGIVAFGNASEWYESAVPFETKFEKLALAVHLAYSDMLDKSGTKEYYDAREEFYSFEYNRRSSMATALHMASKLVSCGVMKRDEYELTDDIADEFEAKILPDETKIYALSKCEHDRWNAFYRSEGYHGASIPEMKQYAEKVGNHKDLLSKTHPCITGWEELVPLADEYNKLMNKNVDFREYDFKIVRAIPKIIRYANKI